MQDESERVLGNSIRQRRRELGLSLNQLAAATGLHKSFLSRVESGAVRQPAVDSLQRIASALQLPETELFGLLDRRAPGQPPAPPPPLPPKNYPPPPALPYLTPY